MNRKASLLLSVLVCCLLAFSAQAQSANVVFEGELGAPVYSTFEQSGGVKWVAYGDVYAPGTFDQRPACSPPNVLTIGRYTARVERGAPDSYSVTYRVTFGTGSEARQFIFSGIVEFQTDELAMPQSATYSAVELIKSLMVGEYQADFTPRSPVCLGGALRIGIPDAGNLRR